jgi:allantoinase
MRTRSGRTLWSVAYPQGLNDIPAIVKRQTDGKDFAQMIDDQFNELLEQSTRQPLTPLAMGIAQHPYIVGQPYRLCLLRWALRYIDAAALGGGVWLKTPGTICANAAGLEGGGAAPFA